LVENLRPPRAVLRIAETLEKAGFETWCVGGAVRDALLGHPHLDWDLATAARPENVMKLFRRTVPVGVAFGTVGVLDDQGILHEVTTFRRDVHTDGRHAVVEFGASLEEDLARRDFTINAIAFDPKSRRVEDPYHGRDDLAKRVIRSVGNAHDRMREDRLRSLRALRFAARFGFEIDPDTWSAITASAPFLGRLSAERVKQEIEKTIRCSRVRARTPCGSSNCEGKPAFPPPDRPFCRGRTETAGGRAQGASLLECRCRVGFEHRDVVGRNVGRASVRARGRWRA
jgi:tRNA nucleotidyltransferase (CCA-adding enzyme)